MESLKRKIKETLLTYEHTRACDNKLIEQLMISCYGLHQRGFAETWKYMPSVQSISRIRREVQEETEATRPPQAVYAMRMKAERDYIRKYKR